MRASVLLAPSIAGISSCVSGVVKPEILVATSVGTSGELSLMH